MQFLVKLRNFSNTPDCDSCEEFNDDFVVTWQGRLPYGSPPIEACTWKYEFPESICSVTDLYVRVYWYLNNYRLLVTLVRTGQANVLFLENWGTSKITCMNFTDYGVPYYLSSMCSVAITCSLTSLPVC